MRTLGPITAPALITRAGADLRARPDDGAGIDRHAAFQARARMHRARLPPRRSPRTSEDGRIASGNSVRVTSTKAR